MPARQGTRRGVRRNADVGAGVALARGGRRARGAYGEQGDVAYVRRMTSPHHGHGTRSKSNRGKWVTRGARVNHFPRLVSICMSAGQYCQQLVRRHIWILEFESKTKVKGGTLGAQ